MVVSGNVKYNLEKLFNEWEKDKFHDQNTFIRDGIISYDCWNKVPVKILYLFKEAYTKGNGNFNLCEEIVGSAPYRNWWTVAKWTYLILEIFNNKKIPEYPELRWEEANELLCNIAVVDIKKSNGQTLSSYSDLHLFIKNDKNKLKKEIDIIDPQIIICGNVFNLYKTIYSNELIEKVKNSKKCFSHNNRLIVDFWHFANRKPNKEVFSELGNILIKAKEA